MQTLGTLLALVLIALVHLFVGRIRRLRLGPRSAWLSFAGGVSLAYVFVYVLPKLAAKHQVLVSAQHAGMLGYLEHHAYLVALAGFLVFYGLDRATTMARRARSADAAGRISFLLAFDLQIAGLSAYGVLVGYLLVHGQKPGVLAATFYGFAVAMHFIGIDYSMWRENAAIYDRFVRWLFAGCTILGWTLGHFVEVSEPVLALWFAFLAGSIVVIVITEEIPIKKVDRFWPLLVGAVSYTALLLGTELLQKAGY
jgi:hypothetical protein